MSACRVAFRGCQLTNGFRAIRLPVFKKWAQLSTNASNGNRIENVGCFNINSIRSYQKFLPIAVERRRLYSNQPQNSEGKQNIETNEKNKSDDQQSSYEQEQAEKHRRSWRNMKISMAVLSGIIVLGSTGFIITYGPAKRDETGHVIVDRFSHMFIITQVFARAWDELCLFVKSVPEPAREKLLPEPLGLPYVQPKYTVVFEISGIIVHPDWTFSTGWRFKKRPAVEYFLKALAYPKTELVVYTSEFGLTAQPLVDTLDSGMSIIYKLYRESTKYQYKDGAHIKDLSKLNRDLSKVIFIDWDPKAFQLNPENTLRIPKWEGSDDDTNLIDLANLILAIVDSDVQDVRPVVQYYSNFDDPLAAFRENQKKLLELEQKKSHLQESKGGDSLVKNFGRSFGWRH